MAVNLSYSFYKDYFSELALHTGTPSYPVFDPSGKIQKILDIKLSEIKSAIDILESFTGKTEEITLTTLYPGLLIGSGYNHEIGSDEKDHRNEPYVKNEFKLGFFFDHTTGVPLLPGSSVKGIIRSAFKKDLKECTLKNKKAKASAYVQYLLNEECKKEPPWTLEDVALLESQIFENQGNTSIYKRDVFLDAYPIASSNQNNDKLLANDYITHHPDPLKNPNPIQFMKIRSDVSFRFNFILQDNLNPSLKKKDKKKLFERILLDLGAGAKTNVGYGQFFDPEKKKNSSGDKPILPDPEKEEKIKILHINQIKKGHKVKATILVRKGRGYTIQPQIIGYDKEGSINYFDELPLDSTVLINVVNIQGSGKTKTLVFSFIKLLKK